MDNDGPAPPAEQPQRHTHLEIRDWSEHQHYHDRRPPWIKLHRSILTNATILALPEVAQAQLIKLWVLASQMGHPLPYNKKMLAGQIGTTGKFFLDQLIASGLMIPCYHDASEELAKVEQNARPLRESTERENRERNTNTGKSADQDAVFLEALAEYPKRPGNSKADTYKQWMRRVGEGVDPLDMLEGARRYRKYVEATKTPPGYIKQSQTFFGPGKHFESDWTPSIADPMAARIAELHAADEAAIAHTAERLHRGAA